MSKHGKASNRRRRERGASTVNVVPNDEPTKLYHYTTIGGLMGILDGEKPHIRASDAQFLNDAKEIEFGLDLVQELLRDGVHTRRNSPPVPGGRQGAEREIVLNEAEKLADDLGVYETFPPVYVVSLSDDGDMLSQWRAYGALGYCIEFDRAQLEAATHARPCHGALNELRRVLYGVDARDDIRRNLIEPLLNNVIDGKDPGPYKNEEGGRLLARAVAWSKHDAFREEQEWRIGIQSPSTEFVEYREHDNGPVPYVTIPLERNAVTAVTVGPSPHKEIRARAVRRWLDGTGYHQVKVRQSIAPYRG